MLLQIKQTNKQTCHFQQRTVHRPYGASNQQYAMNICQQYHHKENNG